MKTFSHALTIFCLAFLAAAAAGTGAPAQTAWSAPGGGASPYTQPGCAQLIGDGGFEAGNVWQLGPTSLAPEYVTYARHGGDYALALGITRGGNKQGFSSARQTVTIPATATKVTLAFWAYTMVEGFGDGDSMQLVLLHPDGSIRDELWDATEDSRLWNQHIFDLTRWRGQTLQVYFNVYNDGVGGTVGMFLDDASLTVCPAPGPTATLAPPPTHTPGITPPWPTLSPTRTPTSSPTPAPTPTPTATATATPLPPFCRDLVQNGGFEAELPPWEAGPATLPAQRAPWPVYHAAWSLRLGTQAANIRSHSPVRQVITLPSAQQVTLSFYVLAWSESLSGDDLQEALIYAADATLLKVAWQILSHEGSWRRIEADLSPYRGQTIQLLFNVYNDGLNGRAAIFLDDVSLVA